MRAALLLGTALLLSACGGVGQRPMGYMPALPPAPVLAAATVDGNGAIYQAANGYAPLYSGYRAQGIGDLVTIRLVEVTSTAKSASSQTQRDGGISVSPPATGPFSFNPAGINSGASSSFNGQGDAAQQSRLQGDITVTIIDVRPNGTALVRGEKLMSFSQGEEWIQLSGIIRLADVTPGNEVFSNRVADARITYGGRGSVQQSSRQGWLTNFFNLVSPF
ncbi:flagellar basal body L-ring protein FlgH [Croceibacterium sp. TMG7-5b_MA50]|uniref:flagellar basal body L-ring protein FlgH n=1 Tax=Croceibacterium sp. TMG7-5b_MA50 TaxID=3121290 RepID=UPI0032215ADB